jgi:hypothetical protein
MEVIFSSKTFYFPGLMFSISKVKRNTEQNVTKNTGLCGTCFEKNDLTAT